MNSKIVFIIACSKQKLDRSAPAIELMQGQLFRSAVKLAKKYDIDVKIISGKHGLIEPTKIIDPYDQKIQNKSDIERIRNKSKVKIEDIKKNYQFIVLIMGKTYQKVFEPFLNSKFFCFYDKRGIGGYLQILTELYNCKTIGQLIWDLEQFRVIDREIILEYPLDCIWNRSDNYCKFYEKECFNPCQQYYPFVSEALQLSFNCLKSYLESALWQDLKIKITEYSGRVLPSYP